MLSFPSESKLLEVQYSVWGLLSSERPLVIFLLFNHRYSRLWVSTGRWWHLCIHSRQGIGRWASLPYYQSVSLHWRMLTCFYLGGPQFISMIDWLQHLCFSLVLNLAIFIARFCYELLMIQYRREQFWDTNTFTIYPSVNRDSSLVIHISLNTK